MALITGSCASIAVIVLVRRSPTPWGWAFIAASAISVLSGVTGLSSHINRPCFALHVFFLLLSVAGQGLGFLMLFSRVDQTERRLKPTTGNEAETRILMKGNAALLLVMFCVEMLVLVLACSLQCCAAEGAYHGLDVEKRRGWGRKLAQVQEESLANATAMEEIHAAQFNDKFKQKYGEGFDP